MRSVEGGKGGSLGSRLVRQLVPWHPRSVSRERSILIFPPPTHTHTFSLSFMDPAHPCDDSVDGMLAVKVESGFRSPVPV